MCNAPKVGEVEERTGFGGGFNERTGVEYIQREESDDEYDAFGRLKKKKKTVGGGAVSCRRWLVVETLVVGDGLVVEPLVVGDGWWRSR